ncbi:hypothetical protein Tco_0995510 [Tanacetum coccineum]
MQPVAPPSPDYIPGPEDPQTPPVPQDKDEREPMFVHDGNRSDYVTQSLTHDNPEYYPLRMLSRDDANDEMMIQMMRKMQEDT